MKVMTYQRWKNGYGDTDDYDSEDDGDINTCWHNSQWGGWQLLQ